MAIRTRWPTSPTSGPLPATPPHAIRTGSWLAREARIDLKRLKLVIAVLCVAAVGQAMMPLVVVATQRWRSHPPAAPHPAEHALPYPKLDLPPEIGDSQYLPMSWSD